MSGEGPTPEQELEQVFRLIEGLRDDSGAPVLISVDDMLARFREAGLAPGDAARALLHAASARTLPRSMSELEGALRGWIEGVYPGRAKSFALTAFSLHEFIRKRFTDRVGKNIIDARSKKQKFSVDAIAQSLSEVGPKFLDIVETLEAIEPHLKPGMNTTDLSRLIYEHLLTRNEAWAKEFDERYRQGLDVVYPNGTRKPLTTTEIKRIIGEAFSSGQASGRKLIISKATKEAIARDLLRRFRSGPARTTKALEIAQLAVNVLPSHWGCSINSLAADLPGLVLDALSELRRIEALPPTEQAKAMHDRIQVFERATQAILLDCGYVPGLDRRQTLACGIRAINDALRDGQSRMAREVAQYLNRTRLDYKPSLPHDLAKVDRFLCRVRAAYDALHNLECFGPKGIIDNEAVEATIALRTLLDVIMWARSIDAEEDLSAQQAILRHVYRQGYCDFYSLTRALRLLPKNVIAALRHLRQQRRIEIHEFTDNIIVELTEEGGKYCHENLGLPPRLDRMPDMRGARSGAAR